MFSDCNVPLFFRKAKVEGGVTSLALRGEGHQFFAGTNACNAYKFNYSDFCAEVYITSHKDEVKDICFPRSVQTLNSASPLQVFF